MEKIDLSICDFPDIIFNLSACCFKWGFYITAPVYNFINGRRAGKPVVLKPLS
ncbi:hypothetical protein AAAY25_09260 [Brotaphodocola catenula]|uniref:Uncharacterized protein n=1 Tax=Brotaphodocola catenula TaxID=2885361 RepID=A0AAE3ATS3_9FIRM|nr:hypothetical protein [Brotaphodocola catenula]MCC2165937.1 hypothetical protein [Brotaphodocola catenula]